MSIYVAGFEELVEVVGTIGTIEDVEPARLLLPEFAPTIIEPAFAPAGAVQLHQKYSEFRLLLPC